MVAEEALITPPYTIDSVTTVSAALNGNIEENAKSVLLVRIKHMVRIPVNWG